MSERWVQAHTYPRRGPKKAAPGLGRLRQPALQCRILASQSDPAAEGEFVKGALTFWGPNKNLGPGMVTLICSTARSVGWHSASALYTHSEWSATFSSNEQGKGQQDVQTAVSLLVNSWPFGTVFSRRLAGASRRPAFPTPTPPLTPGLLCGNKKHWCSL